MAMERGNTQMREYVYDFAVDGGATGDLELRAADGMDPKLEEGTLVKDIVVVNELALAGGTAITFGTKTDPDGFLADCRSSIGSLAGAVRAGNVAGALLCSGADASIKAHVISSTANDQKPVMNIGTAAITAGKLRVMLELYKPGSQVGNV